MKSQFQTLSFLSNYTPKSDLDQEFIESFLVQRFQITPRTLRNAPNSSSNTIDVSSFIQWFESGLEALKIARFQNSLVILGNCTLEKCEIIGTLLEDGTISTKPHSVPPSEISPASADDIETFQLALLTNKLQPDPNKLRLVPKHIPNLGERVIFYDYAQEVQGVGVVRNVTPEGNVIFFCYFTYPTYSQKRRIGFSLYEDPGYNLRSMVFESIDRENIQTTLGNSTSCFRRLGRELERKGKVWKDKLLRIEPLNVKTEKGGKYWYISDKLKVVMENEKGTPTSHLRYLAGNYFTSHKAATQMLGKLNELLRDYLASPKWPEVE
jgi:hypothetical protein